MGIKGPVGSGTSGCFHAAGSGGERVCLWLQDRPGVSQESSLRLTGPKESGMSLSTPCVNWARS